MVKKVMRNIIYWICFGVCLAVMCFAVVLVFIPEGCASDIRRAVGKTYCSKDNRVFSGEYCSACGGSIFELGMFSGDNVVCGKCGNTFSAADMTDEIKNKEKLKYCPKCGDALDEEQENWRTHFTDYMLSKEWSENEVRKALK